MERCRNWWRLSYIFPVWTAMAASKISSSSWEKGRPLRPCRLRKEPATKWIPRDRMTEDFPNSVVIKYQRNRILLQRPELGVSSQHTKLSLGPRWRFKTAHMSFAKAVCVEFVSLFMSGPILYKILFTLLTRERSTAGKRLAMSSTWACRFLRSPRTSFNCHWRRKESECVIDYSVSARIVYTSLINKSKSACPASWQLEWDASSARTTKVQVVQQPIFTDDLVWTWWWGTRARWRVSYSSETVPFMLSVTTGRRCVVFTIAKQTGELLTESLLKADRLMFILTLHPVVLIHIGDSTCLPGF